MPSLGDCLITISAFYDTILASLAGGKFSTTTMVVIQILFFLLAVVRVSMATLDWLKHHSPDGGIVLAIIDYGKVCGRIWIVWGLVAAAPIMVGAISSSAIANVSGLNTKVATQAQTVLNAMGAQVSTIWDCQSTVSNNLAQQYPWMFDGMSDASQQANDAAAVQQALQRSQAAANLQIQGQLSQAQKLMASSDPKLQAQGQAIKTQANQALKNLQQGLDAANTSKTTATSTAQQQAQDYNGFTMVSVLRSFAGGFSLGISELFLLLKRCLAGVAAFIVLLPSLILAVMACWKLIQACIGIFSHICSYVAVLTLASAFGVAIAPLMMLSYLSEEFKRYGQAFTSFWLQALAGSIVLGVGVKLAVIAMGGLSILCISAGSAVVAALMGSNVGMGATMLMGIVAALPFVAAGFAVDFYSQFIQKAPTAGIGQFNGSFHP